MRVLLIAYEYPPIVAAQALRWYYLANGMARCGVEVHVVCPDMEALPAYPHPSAPGLIEHRVWPGPFIGTGQRMSRYLRDRRHVGTGPVQAGASSPPRSFLTNMYSALRTGLDHLLYPDVRTEWYPFARRRLISLIEKYAFDAVISSHEPGVDLLLGYSIKRRSGLPWVVDLADPLLAPYSPKWRGWLDLRVERRIQRAADKVILTTDTLGTLLAERHGQEFRGKFVCIPQGGPDWAGEEKGQKPEGGMHVVYTGNFYAGFRNPRHLAEAMHSLAPSGVRLTVAGDNAAFQPLFSGLDNVTFLGKQNHFECLALQRQADVLLNLGNAQSYQIPGKIYEYLAARKPILHIRMGDGDPSETLLAQSGLGKVVNNTPQAIQQGLSELHRAWQNGQLAELEPNTAFVGHHSWGARSAALVSLLESLVQRPQ